MIIGAAHPQTITIVAEYSMDGGATWKPYSLFSRYDAFCGGGSNAVATAQVQGNFDIARADPRTDRISTAMGWPGIGNNTYWPSSATVYNSTAFAPSKLRGFTFNYGTTPIAKFAVNLSSTTIYYTDPDGVVRPGDAYLNNPPTGDGCPTFNGGTTTGRRPVILNRPFRSVGELGYVFRDLPFKSLDFWSSSSADGALLDLFGVNDNEPPVVAGQVDPNNAPAPVLQAIIAGTMKNESTSLTCSNSDAQTIAVQLASKIGATPLGNRADLAAAVSGAVNAAMAAVPDLRNKAYGETAVRALSSVTNTRTWNLLIDVIAQSGGFTPVATDLNRGFAVQGERRYWLHIAIDRFTGKVVDQQLEPVYE